MFLSIPHHLQVNLNAKVMDFIFNDRWNFSVLNRFPHIKSLAEHVTIPFELSEDKRIWKSSDNGFLTFKNVYEFKYGVGQNIKWVKDLWCTYIPPTKSFMVWRIMHNKVPTDENLWSRGF